ncbi:MAG TPA: hypothetical protein VKY85_01725 [Candidatus Angelobacter sp.]|nr:hypothetical protein [Candidatus Angelobacter sp.]
MDILNELRRQRDSIDAAIEALTGRGWNKRGRVRGSVARTRRGRRRLSAEARQRISDIAKARWAQVKRAGKNSL